MGVTKSFGAKTELGFATWVPRGVDRGEGIEELDAPGRVEVDEPGTGPDHLEAVGDGGGGEGVRTARGGRRSVFLPSRIMPAFSEAPRVRTAGIRGGEVGSRGEAVGPRLGVRGEERIVGDEGGGPETRSSGEPSLIALKRSMLSRARRVRTPAAERGPKRSEARFQSLDSGELVEPRVRPPLRLMISARGRG